MINKSILILAFSMLVLSLACKRPGHQEPAKSMGGASGNRKWDMCCDLLDKKDYKKIETLLADWADPNDPEKYVCESNMHYAQASVIIVQSGKPGGEKDALVFSDEKTGKQVGFIGPGYDPEKMNKAIATLKVAVGKFPLRLDIHFGLAHLCQESGDFECQYRALVKALEVVKANPSGMLWMENKPLGTPVDVFIPDAIHDYSRHYWMRETKEGDEKFLRLVSLGLENYPHSTFLLNDMGGYWSMKKDHTKALTYYFKASEIDPKDSLIINNIAQCYIYKNDLQKAKFYLDKVISLNNDPDEIQAAKEKLQKIDKSK